MKMYAKFGAMILTSVVVMFILTYFNVAQLDHIFFSETRLYAAIMMGSAMAIIMLLYMRGMYKNKRMNAAIIIGSVIVFAIALFLVRSQATIQDVSWMRAMIPHHSIAILNSENAHISDPRVRELADQIIKSQQEEIAEMKALIAELSARK